MAHHNFIVCDFETGGFDLKLNPVMEGAFIVLNGVSLQVEEQYEKLILPYDDSLIVEKAARDVHGITDNELQSQGISLKQFVTDLCKMFKRHKSGKYRKPIIVAQNADFEKKCLEELFTRLDLDLYDFVDRIFTCTQRMSMQKWPNETVHKLGNICKRIGIHHIDAHRAMKDTIVTADVFKYLLSQLRQDTTIELSQGNVSNRDDFQFQLG